MHFSAKKSTTNLVLLFSFLFPSPAFASKSPKNAVLAFQTGKKVGRKRGLRRVIISGLIVWREQDLQGAWIGLIRIGSGGDRMGVKRRNRQEAPIT